MDSGMLGSVFQDREHSPIGSAVYTDLERAVIDMSLRSILV
jgi:hypothetical protein